MLRLADAAVELLAAVGGQHVQLADGVHAHLLFLHLGQSLAQVFFEHVHEGAHLQRRASPVFRGKGIEGQPRNAFFQTEVDDALHRLAAVLVPLGTG